MEKEVPYGHKKRELTELLKKELMNCYTCKASLYVFYYRSCPVSIFSFIYLGNIKWITSGKHGCNMIMECLVARWLMYGVCSIKGVDPIQAVPPPGTTHYLHHTIQSFQIWSIHKYAAPTFCMIAFSVFSSCRRKTIQVKRAFNPIPYGWGCGSHPELWRAETQNGLTWEIF